MVTLSACGSKLDYCKSTGGKKRHAVTLGWHLQLLVNTTVASPTLSRGHETLCHTSPPELLIWKQWKTQLYNGATWPHLSYLLYQSQPSWMSSVHSTPKWPKTSGVCLRSMTVKMRPRGGELRTLITQIKTMVDQHKHSHHANYCSRRKWTKCVLRMLSVDNSMSMLLFWI